MPLMRLWPVLGNGRGANGQWVEEVVEWPRAWLAQAGAGQANEGATYPAAMSPTCWKGGTDLTKAVVRRIDR